MYDLILQLAVFFSLGAIIYLVSRALPRINDVEIEVKTPLARFDSFLAKLPLEKLDAIFGSFLEKALRRFRVGVLRLDNWLNYKINQVKETNGTNGNGKNSFNGQHALLQENSAEEK
ncbi:MAG: hypothetical protein HYW34_02040 [Candidatus Brennerbacteria bacterium]|nr:hypothetical protein [Candidatus Brennerbacteria bacterium]